MYVCMYVCIMLSIQNTTLICRNHLPTFRLKLTIISYKLPEIYNEQKIISKSIDTTQLVLLP